MMSFLLGHNLFGYVDGSISAFAATLSVTNNDPAPPNPTFATWFQTDQLVVSYLTSTISNKVFSVFLLAFGVIFAILMNITFQHACTILPFCLWVIMLKLVPGGISYI
ncbi:hypothetical protein FF1_000169 [Malus domestica]